MQNVLARVVVPNRPPGSSSLHLLKQLDWLPVERRVKFKIATLTFKTLETGQPPYLAQQLCPYVTTRALCSSTSKLLQVPCTNLQFGSCSLSVSAPTLWNSLPHSVRFCESLSTFRKHLKTLFQICISWRPLATHHSSTSDSIFDFWRFINSFTYLLMLVMNEAAKCWGSTTLYMYYSHLCYS